MALRIRLSNVRFFTNKTSKDSPAIGERFNQILDDKLSEVNTSILSANPEFKKIQEKFSRDSFDDATFRKQYQPLMSIVGNEALKFNKHAKELADPSITKPWTGTESIYDSNLRMLVDSNPVPIGVKVKQKRRVKGPERLLNAKEGGLDYRINKGKKEEDNVREIYRERILGPSMFINTSSPHTSLGFATTLAEARINSQIEKNTGKFEHERMKDVRGKPLSKEHLTNCMNSDYFMNKILQNQEVLPPLVESQQRVTGDIENFKNDLDNMWYKTFFKVIDTEKRNETEWLETFHKINKSLIRNIGLIEENKSYLNEKTKLLNAEIRSYNLQTPSGNFHKMKLDLNNEIEKSFHRSTQNIKEKIHDLFQGRAKQVTRIPSDQRPSLFGGLSLNSSIPQRKVGKLNAWNSFKDMFKELRSPVT